MTEWVDDPTGGRNRGPGALVRAWYEAVVHPRSFFDAAVAPGDQAPGLVFAMTVVLLEEVVRIVVAGGSHPVVGGQRLLSAVLFVGLVVVLVTPAALHLLAAAETVLLRLVAPDRGGISETVQVLAYSTAPCVAAGLPWIEVRILAAAYGVVLLFVGTWVVHGIQGWRRIVAATVPAVVVFGYGFRAFHALGVILRRWYII